MKIFHCGDSYTIGIGCYEPNKQSYARLFSDYYDSPYINLGKSGASNYLINLQMRYAVENGADFILVNTTVPDRIEWIKEGKDTREPLSALNIAYEGYNDALNGSWMQSQPGYDPVILSEPVSSIEDIINSGIYERRLSSEPTDKLKLIAKAYLATSSIQIELDFDAAILVSACLLAEKANIPYLLMGNIWIHHKLKPFITEKNLMELDAVDYSLKWPDALGTKHCTPEAHEMIFNEINTHVKKYNLIHHK